MWCWLAKDCHLCQIPVVARPLLYNRSLCVWRGYTAPPPPPNSVWKTSKDKTKLFSALQGKQNICCTINFDWLLFSWNKRIRSLTLIVRRQLQHLFGWWIYLDRFICLRAPERQKNALPVWSSLRYSEDEGGSTFKTQKPSSPSHLNANVFPLYKFPRWTTLDGPLPESGI